MERLLPQVQLIDTLMGNQPYQGALFRANWIFEWGEPITTLKAGLFPVLTPLEGGWELSSQEK